MKPLQIDIKTAQRLYPGASAEFKALLEDNFNKKELQTKITDRIKSYEDACYELSEEPIDERLLSSLGFRPDEIVRRKIETITLALNEGKVMDWNNSDQQKWYPWFDASSGLAFHDATYYYSSAIAGIASRLCFKSDELATYAGRQFTDLYKTFMLNN